MPWTGSACQAARTASRRSRTACGWPAPPTPSATSRSATRRERSATTSTRSRPGGVAVLDNQGRTDATVWGDILTEYAASSPPGGHRHLGRLPGHRHRAAPALPHVQPRPVHAHGQGPRRGSRHPGPRRARRRPGPPGRHRGRRRGRRGRGRPAPPRRGSPTSPPRSPPARTPSSPRSWTVPPSPRRGSSTVYHTLQRKGEVAKAVSRREEGARWGEPPRCCGRGLGADRHPDHMPRRDARRGEHLPLPAPARAAIFAVRCQESVPRLPRSCADAPYGAHLLPRGRRT